MLDSPSPRPPNVVACEPPVVASHDKVVMHNQGWSGDMVPELQSWCLRVLGEWAQTSFAALIAGRAQPLENFG